jgi:murein DD-endopeptidase MepM/ murein hydrolase activator NlpD
MTKWTAAFSEGNFEIKANFLGYSTSFFSDILMDHVRAVVETPSGKAELKKVFKGKQITTINEMLNNIGNVGKYVENIKAKNNVKDDQGYGRLVKLNETLTNLSVIRNIIGIPIQNLLPTEPNYNSLEGPYIKYEGLVARENIFSFRDIMLIPNGPNGATLISYNKFRENIVSQMEKYDDALIGIGGNKYVDSYGISKAIGKEIKEILPKLDGGTEDVKSVVTSINGILVNGGNGRPIDKGYVDSEEFKKPPFELFTGLTNTIKIDQKANMYDFYKIRDVVNKIYVNLIQERKQFADEVTEKINKEIDKKYGFNPSVGDVFEILCNNVEAYINTIYRVSLNAESKDTNRVKILTGLENDSDGGRVYPWPMLYENNVETYIGNNKKVIKDESAFPEVAFIEEILNAQIKENDSNNDNVIPLPNDKRSFPINPGDLPSSSDPYPYNISNTNQVVLENLMSNIIKRAVISYDYSCLKDNINDIAKLEAASLFSSVVDSIDKNVINLFLENNKSNYFNLPIVQKNLSMVKSGSTYYFGGTLDLNNNYKNISSGIIGSKTLFFDTSINSVSSVTTDFLNQNDYDLLTNVKNTLGDKSVSDVFTPKKDGMDFNTTTYSVEQILTKMCWDEAVLDGKSYPQADKLKNYVGAVKDGITQNTYYLYNSPSYQNYSATTVTQVLGGGLYNNLPENQFRGMMILSTYPFKGIDKLVENLTDITKVVNVPLAYLAWIGSHMKRQQLFIKNNDVDLIGLWFNVNNEFSPDQIGDKNDYLSLGSKTNNKGTLPKPFNNYNLFNPTIESVFIGVFEYWCYLAKESGLIDYYLELGGQTLTSQSLQQIEELGSQINLTKILNSIDYKTTNELIELVSYTPNFWNLKTDPTFKIDESVLNNYLNVFSEKYSQLSNGVKISTPNYLTPRKLDDKDIKLATYKTVKNLYDKWIGGSKDGEQPFNVGVKTDKTNKNPSLYSSFKFIDQDYNDISDTAKINLKSVLSILDNPNMNFLTLISKILSDNNFLLHKLPVYIDYSNFQAVKDVFDVFPTITEINSGVSYIAMYGTGNSKLLDIPTGFGYKPDGYDFIEGNTDSSALPNNLTKSAKAGKSKNLVAFRVAFGDENQSIFKNIRISQEEMSDTGEYLKLVDDLFNGKGGTNRVPKGVDLYHLNTIRSYNVNMDMMGNAMIQPLMYLQLDNIPMFHGAYSVININHEITPNKMNTTIRAVKQSKYRTPIVTESTTFVPLDLTKGLALNGGFKVATVTNIESDVIDTKTNNSFTAPVDGDIVITSKLGPRGGKNHDGIDIGVSVGTPIKASWGGTVNKFLQGPNGTQGYGLYVIIDHSDETNKPFDDGYYYYTLYAHLSECALNSNVKVQGNQVFAKSGGKYGENNSGNSKGPHLHYEIRRSSNRLKNIQSEYYTLKGLNIVNPEMLIKKLDQKIAAGTPQHGQLGNTSSGVIV